MPSNKKDLGAERSSSSLSSETAARDRRRSPRIIARIPLVVRPIQAPGAVLTAVINLHGALILSPVLFSSGTILEIKNPRTELTAQARVVWSGGEDGSGIYKLGVEFEKAAPDFWGDDYNPEDASSVFD